MNSLGNRAPLRYSLDQTVDLAGRLPILFFEAHHRVQAVWRVMCFPESDSGDRHHGLLAQHDGYQIRNKFGIDMVPVSLVFALD